MKNGKICNMAIRTCKRCGKRFERIANFKKYCKVCRQLIILEMIKRRKKSQNKRFNFLEIIKKNAKVKEL